ncbi:MAG: hypothetical protein F6K00_11660 [Leptolyngbya sp. SIOISBB]|nr:hypothetical protein [Leptolyngbya sp. SIOISBB]
MGSVDDVYYSGSGYAVITDFSQVEGDQIWVHGSLDDYVLDTHYGPGGSSEQDTHIFRNGDLIGMVQGNTEVPLGNDIISAPVPRLVA